MGSQCNAAWTILAVTNLQHEEERKLYGGVSFQFLARRITIKVRADLVRTITSIERAIGGSNDLRTFDLRLVYISHISLSSNLNWLISNVRSVFVKDELSIDCFFFFRPLQPLHKGLWPPKLNHSTMVLCYVLSNSVYLLSKVRSLYC